MPKGLTVKVQETRNGQRTMTLPRPISEILSVKGGDKVRFNVDLSKGKVWVEKIQRED